MFFDDQVPVKLKAYAAETRDDALEKAKEERLMRKQKRKELNAAIVLQSHARSMAALAQRRQEITNALTGAHVHGQMVLKKSWNAACPDIRELHFACSRVRPRQKGVLWGFEYRIESDLGDHIFAKLIDVTSQLNAKLMARDTRFFDDIEHNLLVFTRFMEMVCFLAPSGEEFRDMLLHFLVHGKDDFSDAFPKIISGISGTRHFLGLLHKLEGYAELHPRVVRIAMERFCRGAMDPGNEHEERAKWFILNYLRMNTLGMYNWELQLLRKGCEGDAEILKALADIFSTSAVAESEKALLMERAMEKLRLVVNTVGDDDAMHFPRLLQYSSRIMVTYYDTCGGELRSHIISISNFAKRSLLQDQVLDYCSALHHIMSRMDLQGRRSMAISLGVVGIHDFLSWFMAADAFALPSPNMLASSWESPTDSLKVLQVFLVVMDRYLSTSPFLEPILDKRRLETLVVYLKDSLVSIALTSEKFSEVVSGNVFLSSALGVLSQLYERSSTMGLINMDLFVKKALRMKRLGNPRIMELMKRSAYLMPLKERISYFMTELNDSRRANATVDDMNMRSGGISFRVHRAMLFDDSFHHFLQAEKQYGYHALRRTLRVEFVGLAGNIEMGFGEGVTKEFISAVGMKAFTEYGLFKTTDAGGVYPDPSAPDIHSNWRELYSFVGTVLGKAIYEGILIDISFARFFLKKMINATISLGDMHSFDSIYYKNLMSLSRMEDVGSLGLTMSETKDSYGTAVTVDLVENGRNVPVVKDNVILYQHLVMDYKLNRQIHRQTAAFLDGFYKVIDEEWLSMFHVEDIQNLISGISTSLDVGDLRAHTKYYTTDFDEKHPTIKFFWDVLENDLNQEDLSLFLKFCTSIERSPLLGFESLQPPFTIAKGEEETDRLPSASTCANLLKLPPYPTRRILQEKLLYAIRSNQGFELS